VTKTKTQVSTRTRVATDRSLARIGLTDLEEKVVRMHHGLPLAADAMLEQRGQEHAETRLALEAIEARALARLRPSEENQILSEIIGGLRD
jgi:DNA-directed RNA polymerase sigma subunit (sigma70/sigma32)